MNSLVDPSLTKPTVEGITLVLDPTLCNLSDEALLRHALDAVATALQQVPSGGLLAWTVQPILRSAAPSFQLAPLLEQEVRLGDVWSFIYALRAQPTVVDAEPAFILTQTNAADSLPSTDAALPATDG